MKKIFFLSLVLVLFSQVSFAKDYLITDYGAVGDNVTLNTASIQKAIDECSGNGGGRVVVPHGTFLSGTLFLRSYVDLYLEHNAVILANPNPNDFPNIYERNINKTGLIHAENIEDASVTGFGTLNGNGSHPVFLTGGGQDPGRTYVIYLKNCKNIKVQDVYLRNPSFWTFRIYGCEDVFVRGIRIYSHANFNNDGIDIDGRNITVSDCLIDSTDDGICLKSENPAAPCENVTITNCVIASNCNAIKFGTASHSGFRNITISNCVIKTPEENDFFNYAGYTIPGVISKIANNSGIALEMVDGGIFEKVSITNITMDNVHTPVFIRLGNRRGKPQFMRDIIISNIIANSTSLMTSSITGIPGYLVENVKISNIIFNCPGGGLKEHVERTVPESERAYPENRMFGANLPSYGFYVRHAKNISLENVYFNVGYKDERPAVWFENVHSACINQIESNVHPLSQPFVWLRNVSDITVSGFKSSYKIPLFLRLEGKNSSDVKLLFNDFSNVSKIYEKDKDLKTNAVIESYNLKSSKK